MSSSTVVLTLSIQSLQKHAMLEKA
ncbi:biofilm formation regulator BssR [Escherichia coli]